MTPYLPWQLRNLHPRTHHNPLRRTRKHWSPSLIHALWGIQLSIAVLLLRNIFTVWRHVHHDPAHFPTTAESTDVMNAARAWDQDRADLAFRWGVLATALLLCGLVTLGEMVAKTWLGGCVALGRVVLVTAVAKGLVYAWLLSGAFAIWQERERERSAREAEYWGWATCEGEELLQPRTVVESKALDVYPRGVDQWVWMALALPTFLAILPAARITYTHWQMVKLQREQKGTASTSVLTNETERDEIGTELTVFLDPRNSVRTRQSIYA